jgi:hypothetical protein
VCVLSKFESYLNLKSSLVLCDDSLLELSTGSGLLLGLIKAAFLLCLHLSITYLLLGTGGLECFLLLK